MSTYPDEFKALEEENESLKEMNRELTELLKGTLIRLARSSCPHAIAAMTWIEQALLCKEIKKG
ncbi:hypothetical protein LCGC14_1806520 [marine sediment metagenome]|uniref:Uncharacterized protein n=1 Tax=marine sediment metagenome TaxID=412755 RepID=A0A0F9JMQ9_9ZZZZ